jgi:Na+/melibiose symporter-like transporter
MSGTVQTWKCGSLLYTKRGLFALFGWLLWGDVCFTLMEAVVPSILPLHFKNLGASNMSIGFVLTTLPGVFNLTVTPWLSFKSDRHRSRWGRRIPFMLFTAPFLALSLIMIGFSDSIGAWVHRAFFSGGTIGQVQVVIVLLTCFAAMFDLFNMFVNTVFWYLFRDVVPESHFSQFNAYFKVVGTTTVTLYNFFIFKYAESHMREIYIGAALLYVIGFGAMLLNVKEGEYPPVTDVTEKTTFLEKIRVYAKECFTLRYYWDIFLWQMFQAVSFACGVYQVFNFKSLGLTLDMIGKKGALAAVTGPVCLLILARYVDRWKPVRVAAYGLAFGAFFAFGNWVWLVIPKPDPLVFFWIFIGSGITAALAGAAGQAAQAPLLMILFPKDKYGQFSGAMALVRAVALMASGILAGAFLDFWKLRFPEGDYSYRFIFLWHGPLTVLSFYFFYRVYRVWKRREKEAEFTPPEEKFRLSDLPPRTEQPSGLLKPVVWFSIIQFGGGILALLVWIGYYAHFVPKPDYVRIFAIALAINTALFFAYLRFMKFMERP